MFIINVYSFENFVNCQIKSHVHRRSRLTQQMLPEKYQKRFKQTFSGKQRKIKVLFVAITVTDHSQELLDTNM